MKLSVCMIVKNEEKCLARALKNLVPRNLDGWYSQHGTDAHAKQLRHEIIPQYIVGKSVLDFGCGTGDLLLALKGFELTGVDSSQVALDMAKQRGLDCELLTKMPNKKFDTIILSQVLEHMPDDWGLLADLSSKVNKRIIISVPKDDLIPDENHIREYSENSLVQLLSEFGDAKIISWADQYRILAVIDKPKPVSKPYENLIDEVCILDTGSNDKTLEIAKQFGCKIKLGGDAMNKGEARTQVLDMATGDYCIMLDADENLANPREVRNRIEKQDADVYYIRETYMNGDKQTLSFSQARIFKKGTTKYLYRAHEVPDWPKGTRVLWTDLVWEHRPPSGRGDAKLIYTLQRLLMDVKEHPDDARPLYYLARQYYYLEQYVAAIKTFEKYLKIGRHDAADAHYFMALSYYALKKSPDAIRSLYQAIASKPDHREYWCLLSGWYAEQKKADLAYSALRFVEKLPAPKYDYLYNKFYGAHYFDELALKAYYAKDYDTALIAGTKAAELSDSKRIKDNLKYYINKSV